jgi:hypothetical protein
MLRGDGERDSIELCGQVSNVETLVTDDYLAFVAATRQGLKAWMLPDLVLELAARGYRPRCRRGNSTDNSSALSGGRH